MPATKKNAKYTPDTLIPVFIKAAALRNELIALGFTDNGGAIHSAERIIDILGQRIKYPRLNHINSYQGYPDAEFSEKAYSAYKRGGKVLIEHVSPLRAFTRKAICLLGEKPEYTQIVRKRLEKFIEEHYRLVLLTPEETIRLNRENRSNMDSQRLEKSGIQVKLREK
jgi:hypothetical protein